MILNYKNFLNELLNSKIITLYHGQKGYRGEKFKEFDFNIFPYFYLTPEYDYCFNYAVDKNAIHTFKVDTTNFVDLSNLKANFDYKTFVRLFHEKTGVYYPSEFKFYSSYLWELIRFDSKGYIAKRLLSKGINGFKMTEWYGFKRNRENEHEVYVLLNNDPIVKEIKESNDNKTIVYRGAPSPEFGKGNWKGVFVSTDLKSAEQYHDNIYKYELSPDVNLLGDPPDEDAIIEPEDLDPETEKISKIVSDYLESDDPDAGWVNEISDLWMFPPDGWIDHLRKLGYDGTILGIDRFIFNTDKLKFIGKL